MKKDSAWWNEMAESHGRTWAAVNSSERAAVRRMDCVRLHLKNNLPMPLSAARVLDLGCGNLLVENALGPFRKYTGVDFSQKLLDTAIPKTAGARLMCRDMMSLLPEEFGEFDVVLCVNVLTQPHIFNGNLAPVLNYVSEFIGSAVHGGVFTFSFEGVQVWSRRLYRPAQGVRLAAWIAQSQNRGENELWTSPA